jgi:hypothetical protein
MNTKVTGWQDMYAITFLELPEHSNRRKEQKGFCKMPPDIEE